MKSKYTMNTESDFSEREAVSVKLHMSLLSRDKDESEQKYILQFYEDFTSAMEGEGLKFSDLVSKLSDGDNVTKLKKHLLTMLFDKNEENPEKIDSMFENLKNTKKNKNDKNKNRKVHFDTDGDSSPEKKIKKKIVLCEEARKRKPTNKERTKAQGFGDFGLKDNTQKSLDRGLDILDRLVDKFENVDIEEAVSTLKGVKDHIPLNENGELEIKLKTILGLDGLNMKDAKRVLKYIVGMIFLGSILSFVKWRLDFYKKLAMISGGILMFYHFGIGSLLKNLFVKLTVPVVTKAQDGFIDDEMVEPITSVLCSMLCLPSMFSKKDISTIIRDCLGSFSRVKQASDGLAFSFRTILKMFEGITRYCKKKIWGDKSPVRFNKFEDQKLLIYLGCVDLIRSKVVDDKLIATPENYDLVHKTYEMGRDIYKNFLNTNRVNLANIVKSENVYVGQWEMKLKQADPNVVGMRREPFCVCIAAEPGRSKSLNTMDIAYQVAPHVLSDWEREAALENLSHFIMNVQHENEFFDTAHPQKYIWTWDDFGQSIDAPGNPRNEFFFFIRSINAFTHVMPAAAIEYKHTRYNTNKITIMSTNRYNFDDLQSIKDKEAIKRRIHLLVRPIVRKEFRVENFEGPDYKAPIDATKLPIGDQNVTLLSPNLYYYEQLIFAGDDVKATGVYYSYPDLINEIIYGVKLRERRHAQYTKQLQETVETAFDRADTVNTFFDKVFEKANNHFYYHQWAKEEHVKFANCKFDKKNNQFIDEHVQKKYERFIKTKEDWLKKLELEEDFLEELEKRYCNTEVAEKTQGQVGNLQMNSMSDFYDTSDYETAPEDFMGTGYPNVKTVLVGSSVFADPDMIESSMKTDAEFKLKAFFVSSMITSELEQQVKDTAPHILKVLYDTHGMEFVNAFRDMDLYHLKFWLKENAEYCDFTEYLRVHLIQQATVGDKIKSFLKGTWETLKIAYEMTCEFFADYSKYFKYIAGAIGAAAGIWGIYAAYSYFSGEDDEITEAESGFRGKKGKTDKGKLRQSPFHSDVRPQGANDSNEVLNVANSVTKKNTFKVYMRTNKGESVLGTGLGLYGNVGLMPLHFIVRLHVLYCEAKENGKNVDSWHVYFKRMVDKEERTGSYLLKDLIDDEKKLYNATDLKHKDLCVVALPKTLQFFPDIMKHIPDLKTYEAMPVNPSAVLVKNTDRSNHYFTITKHEEEEVGSDYGFKWKIYDSFYYSNPKGVCDDGHCGSLLFSSEGSVKNHSLIGMHVAGASTWGFSSSLIREEIENAINYPQFEKQTFKQKYVENEIVKCQDGLDPLIIDEREFQVVGLMKKTNKVARETKIQQSDLSRMVSWKPEKLPAALKPTLLGDPLLKGIKNYSLNHTYINSDVFEYLIEFMVDECTIRSKERELEFRMLTFEEAVCGVDGDPFLHGEHRSTSPGYPWKFHKKYRKGKAFIYGNNEKFDLETPLAKEVREQVETIIEEGKRGIRGFHPTITALKDELRKKKKVEDLDTRLFFSTSHPLQVSMKMAFHSFFANLMAARIINFDTVGINPYGVEWELLYKQVTTFGIYQILAGDYAKYDGSALTPVQWAVCEVIIRCFERYAKWTPELRRMQETFWWEVANSRHIFLDKVIEFLTGLCSGVYSTTQINSMTNRFYFLLFWISLHNDNPQSVVLYLKHIRDKYQGDDHLVGVSAEYSDRINELAVSKFMKDKLGLTYTSETKGNPSPTLRSIYDVSFLKRKFRYSEVMGRHVAPLSLETILEMVHWTKPTTDFRQKLQTCIWELSLHDKETYDRYVPEITEKAWRLYGYNFETSYCLNQMKICGLDIREVYPADVEA